MSFGEGRGWGGDLDFRWLLNTIASDRVSHHLFFFYFLRGVNTV